MPSPDQNVRGPHVRIPRLEARLRKEVLLERVAEYDRGLAADLRAVDAQLSVYETIQGTQYAQTRSTQKAVLACLGASHGPMRPREIAAALAEGGFVMDPANGPRLVVDSIRGMVEGGKLVRQGELVDLPERVTAK